MVAIGAIFKNEYPYVLEWVAYHQELGVDKFYIADNVSSDGCSELLEALHEVGVIERVVYPTQDGVPPQLGAYQGILSRALAHEWVAFIDADEFLRPEDMEGHLNCLGRFLSDDSIGAVCVNWATYGSCFSVLPEDALVVERFFRRADQGFGPNRHLKSIVRVSAVANVVSPHRFALKDGFRTVNMNAASMDPADLSESVVWAGLRLNHYVVKSRGEYFLKKRSRGRADTLDAAAQRDADFFSGHDVNHVADCFPRWLVSAVKRRVALLIRQLEDSGYCLQKPASFSPFFLAEDGRGRGVVDEIYFDGAILTARGWAVNFDGAAVYSIVAVVDNQFLVEPSVCLIENRPDVVSAGVTDVSGCGFRVFFPFAECGFELNFGVGFTVDLYAINRAGLGVVRLLGDLHFPSRV